MASLDVVPPREWRCVPPSAALTCQSRRTASAREAARGCAWRRPRHGTRGGARVVREARAAGGRRALLLAVAARGAQGGREAGGGGRTRGCHRPVRLLGVRSSRRGRRAEVGASVDGILCQTEGSAVDVHRPQHLRTLALSCSFPHRPHVLVPGVASTAGRVAPPVSPTSAAPPAPPLLDHHDGSGSTDAPRGCWR